MSQIKVKNFGPIKEGLLENDGWLDISKVTVFLGNQGSGKSVVAKLISTFTWMEKVLTRGDYDKEEFEEQGHFVQERLSFHRIDNYLDRHGRTLIEYKGESRHFRFAENRLTISEIQNGSYELPQIVYVPAERNFISYVQTPMASKQISPALSEFVEEVNNAAKNLSRSLILPINEQVFVEYQANGNIFYLQGKDYRLNLTEASSGFQSLVPLYLVAQNLSESVYQDSHFQGNVLTPEQRERIRERLRKIIADSSLSEDLRRIALQEVAKDFKKTAFIDIVEEPEQNLFPESQWDLLIELLEFNNKNKGNKLIVTSHSPYLVNYFSIAIQASYLQDKIIQTSLTQSERDSKLDQLRRVIPLEAAIASSHVIIYELDERTGLIGRLPSPEGIPSDKNYLNQSLRHGNELFDQLLDIEQEL
ncbi:hypothetical protein A4H97_20870 [Niastella yeongjuensis]|uniref:Endonuclease GajA/Old nuclease/RecF-like AAA domain-containing protein n=1 Tax=Niastella yeongjuensis TaxID=354355 RepID=A0A1V9FCY8_9BACT|nr:AAA family ATPase [Niastella yeongjuensis]OQP56036.1 hypothetical protein A4H97_20870 [Niastella yeongjuensis]SEP24582.1 Predicted ATPase [Niastella yeongjuensis]